MPTKYVLFGMQERAAGGQAESGALATGGRTRWKAQLDVARWGGAGNLEVVVEVSPTGLVGSWNQVATFGVLTDAGGALSVTKDSTKQPSEFTAQITQRDVWIRLRINSQTAAKVTFGCTASAAWVDHTYQADKALLSAELVSAVSSIARIMDEAEGDVVSLLTRKAGSLVGTAAMVFYTHAPDIVEYVTPEAAEALAGAPRTQVFDAGLDLPGFFEAMQSEVVAQAEHLFQREQLRRQTGDREAQITWRKMGRLAPGLGQRLAAYRPSNRDVWLGR